MGFWNSLLKNASQLAGVGNASLKDAADPAKTANNPGVYILTVNGDIKKAGSAEIGIQMRMQQYYGLNPACGLTSKIDKSNRDQIKVKWQYCSPSQCQELESKLNDKYSSTHSFAWSQRRPRSNADTVQLKI